jgi:hypothetical protein
MSNKPIRPYKAFPKNESSTVLLNLTHLDSSKVLAAPTTLTYRIDDLTNNRQVLDWTTVATPGTTNTVTVTPAQNALYNRTIPQELRQITVKTVDSSSNETLDIFHYRLTRIFKQEDWAS